MSSLSTHYFQTFDYLDTRDIISLRQTNRFWHQLTTMTPIWTRLRFRGLPIVDWPALSSKVIGSSNHLLTVLDFEGVKIPSTVNTDQSSDDSSSTRSSSKTEKLITFWRNFSTLHEHMSNLKMLKFGTVPLFVLQEMVQLPVVATEEDEVVPLGKLKVLSVVNLIDEKRSEEPVHLKDVVPVLERFSHVEAVSLNSNNGFVVLEDDGEVDGGEEQTDSQSKRREKVVQSLAAAFSKYTNLKSLSLTSIKDLTSAEFSQVLAGIGQQHSQLKTLELGSCASWNTTGGSEDSTGPLDKVAKCTEVTTFKMVDVMVDSKARPLALLFENLILVERLSFENLKVDDSGKYTLCWWYSLLWN